MASISFYSPSRPMTASCHRPKNISTSSICSASRWRSSSSPRPIWRPTRIADVEEEIDILTLGTILENSPKIAVSSVTGQGLDELKQLISTTLKSANHAAPIRLLSPAGGPGFCPARPWRRRHRHVALRRDQSRRAGALLARRQPVSRAQPASAWPIRRTRRLGPARRDEFDRTGARLHRARPGHLPRETGAYFGTLRRLFGSPSRGGEGHQKSSAPAHPHGRGRTPGQDRLCSATKRKPSRRSRSIARSLWTNRCW